MEAEALARSSFFADYLADTLEFLRHLLVGGDDGIESVGDLSFEAGPRAGQADGKVAIAHGLQTGEDGAEILWGRVID